MFNFYLFGRSFTIFSWISLWESGFYLQKFLKQFLLQIIRLGFIEDFVIGHTVTMDTTTTTWDIHRQILMSVWSIMEAANTDVSTPGARTTASVTLAPGYMWTDAPVCPFSPVPSVTVVVSTTVSNSRLHISAVGANLTTSWQRTASTANC